METLVNELKRLALNEPDISGFYRQSIEIIADRLDAQAVMVWDCNSLPYQPIQQISRESEAPIRVGISQAQHIELLSRAVSQDRPTLTRANDNDDPGNAHLLLCPVKRGENRDLVEVFVRSNQTGSTYHRNRTDLAACCQAISQSIGETAAAQQAEINPSDYGGTKTSGTTIDPDSQNTAQSRFTIERFDHFAENLHQSIDFKSTCFNIANEAQSLLGCDRVVVVRFERKAKTVAVSGLPKFNRRSNALTLLEQLSTAVLKTGQAYWYPDGDSQQLPQISGKLDRYLSEGVTRSLVILPIRENRGDTRLSPEEIQFEKRNVVIGAIVFENFSGEWQQDCMAEPITMIGRHANSAYRNAHQHNDLFMYPVWRTFGKLKALTAPRYLSKTLLIGGLILALLASLFLVPSTMTVSGDGKLVPKTRRTVFAQVGGQVESIAVQHGSRVESGQLLLQMIGSDLEIQLNEIDNKIELAGKQIEALDNQRMSALNSGRTQQEMAQEDLEHSSLLNQLESFKNERDLFQQEFDRLKVTSPIAGQVITANLREQLMDRPVRPGQTLIEVADTSGEWIIEMDLPDRRIGHLLRAQKELGDELKVTFILAADPGRKLTGTVFDVALATQVQAESGQTIRVKIKIDHPENVDIRQVGTDATVRIECGQCSLGYSMFRDIGEFFQSKVLFHFQ